MKAYIPVSPEKSRIGIKGKKFVMVVDLAKCGNARECVELCRKAHNLQPNQEFMKVLKMKDSVNTAPYWFPKPCFHCDSAACVKVKTFVTVRAGMKNFKKLTTM